MFAAEIRTMWIPGHKTTTTGTTTIGTRTSNNSSRHLLKISCQVGQKRLITNPKGRTMLMVDILIWSSMQWFSSYKIKEGAYVKNVLLRELYKVNFKKNCLKISKPEQFLKCVEWSNSSRNAKKIFFPLGGGSGGGSSAPFWGPIMWKYSKYFDFF